MSATVQPPTLDRAGKYRLGPLLGVGGMAEVYRAWVIGQSGVERLVAVKRILPGLLEGHAHLRELFVNEARLCSFLHHANIVQLIDFDQDSDGRLFQVLEFVEGTDLEHATTTHASTHGLLPVPIACYIAGQVLRALDYAYGAPHPQTGRQLGIVHRDVTPSNVMLTWSGDVKVADFGVAKAVLATNATMSGRVAGKPRYMSPEQATGAPLDSRSDLFAVGSMLYEMLTGHYLFDGQELSVVLLQVLDYGRRMRPLVPAHELNPSVPRALSLFVTQLLQVDRQDRPADAGEAYRLLRGCGVPFGDAAELAAVLAQRFPGAAPQRSNSQASGTPADRPRAQEVMQRETRSVVGSGTPMAGELTRPAAPRGARVGLAVAATLVAAVAAVTIALAMSDDAGSPAPAANAPVSPVVAAPPSHDEAVAVPTDAPAAVVPMADAGLATVPEPHREPADVEPAASADKKKPKETKPRSRRPRSQIHEVQLGGEK